MLLKAGTKGNERCEQKKSDTSTKNDWTHCITFLCSTFLQQTSRDKVDVLFLTPVFLKELSRDLNVGLKNDKTAFQSNPKVKAIFPLKPISCGHGEKNNSSRRYGRLYCSVQKKKKRKSHPKTKF